MDLNDDLGRTEFYDFINPKMELGTNGLTPVAFIDPVDYITSVTDSNNNGTANMKSFLDEMLFAEPNGTTMHHSNSTTNSSPSTNGGDETDNIGLPSINSTFELMGAFQWSNISNGNMTDSNSDSNNTNWLSSPENEVTTLTNLLIDPLFVSYNDNEDIASMNCGKIQYFTTNSNTNHSNGESALSLQSNCMNGNPTMVSSDQITTTFHNDHNSKSYHHNSSDTIVLNGGDHELSWQKQNSPNSPFIYCDESLLRSALQTGKVNGSILQSGNINLNTASGKTNNNNSTMTELRKVLAYPALSVNSDSTSTPSPTSTSTISPIPSTLLLDNDHSNTLQSSRQQQPYFEFKILDPMFNSQVETIIIDESNIPNVEELIMTRIDNNKNSKKMEISERKINSTTLSTKWTYTTNTQSKSPKRRRTKGTAGTIKQNSNINSNDNNNIDTNNENSISHSSDNSRSPSDSNNNATSRKERSLHYCNICNKGFKDKYSVNVHVRTHTGEKPFGCFCGKHFRQKAHLAKHHQTHAAKANGHPGKGKRASS